MKRYKDYEDEYRAAVTAGTVQHPQYGGTIRKAVWISNKWEADNGVVTPGDEAWLKAMREVRAKDDRLALAIRQGEEYKKLEKIKITN